MRPYSPLGDVFEDMIAASTTDVIETTANALVVRYPAYFRPRDVLLSAGDRIRRMLDRIERGDKA